MDIAAKQEREQAGPSLRPVMVVAVITAICLLGDSSLYILLPANLDAFQVTAAGAGLVLGINRYIRVLSNGAAAFVYQRVGFMVPFALSVALGALTTVSYGLSPGFWPLFIAHAIWGVSWSFLRLGGYLVAIESARGGHSALPRGAAWYPPRRQPGGSAGGRCLGRARRRAGGTRHLGRADCWRPHPAAIHRRAAASWPPPAARLVRR